MAIIPSIGRKSFKLRFLIASIYLILIVGSMTTVYPFAIMFATSLTSHTDYEQYRLIPLYLRDDKVLTAKYLEEKNRGTMFDVAKLRYHIEEPVPTEGGGTKKYGRFIEMRHLYETFDLDSPLVKARLADWEAFKKELPLQYCDTYFHARVFAIGETQAAFQRYLKVKYPTPEILRASLDEMPKQYVVVTPPYDAYDKHSWYPARDPKSVDWEAFRATLPARALNVMTARPLYQKFLLDKYPKIEDLNAAWGTSYRFFWEAPFPSTVPQDKSAADWTEFVRLKVPMRYARLDVAASRQPFVDFIREKYGTIEKYNGLTGQSIASFEALEPSAEMPQTTLLLADWQEFYEKRAPLSCIVLDTADQRYARFLEGRYKDVASLSAAYGTDFASFDLVEPPYREEDYADLTTRKSGIKWNYVTRNYALVLERVFLQGRPIFNTTLLVLLTVASAVTINPLAAYALSRYRLSYTAKVLVFMLATMAFPAEVAMIPNFLMIKQLGLLNTFGALILPGLASGYFIFLLKGFFDSLPAELYEAASIDGASEIRMFYTITLPLSLPVLSVIALFAFGGAYGSFLWSFTTCQDPKMWTLMVFLQQFQIEAASCPYIVMASLVLAAIPTMIVFLSAQKVLMKGIVIPTMK